MVLTEENVCVSFEGKGETGSKRPSISTLFHCQKRLLPPYSPCLQERDLSYLWHIAQEPGQLGCREVSGKWKTTLVPEVILTKLLCQLVDIHTVPESMSSS